jgi:hypothetical protein
MTKRDVEGMEVWNRNSGRQGTSAKRFDVNYIEGPDFVPSGRRLANLVMRLAIYDHGQDHAPDPREYDSPSCREID